MKFVLVHGQMKFMFENLFAVFAWIFDVFWKEKMVIFVEISDELTFVNSFHMSFEKSQASEL
jgi:hypothetical protein